MNWEMIKKIIYNNESISTISLIKNMSKINENPNIINFKK